MKGIDFHKRVKISGLGWKVVAEKLGLSKQGLYNLYDKEVVDEKYLTKAKELGLTEVALSQRSQPDDTITAKEALEIAERMAESVRADYKDRIAELNRTINLLTGLLKKNKIVA